MIEQVGAAFEALAARAHGRTGRDVPIAPLTSYQLGGPAAIYLEAESYDDLAALADAMRIADLPLLVVGRGSNMLVSDRGFPGFAVRLGSGFRWARVDGTSVAAGAAMPVPAVATMAADAQLSGFEFAMAIPASFGGAIAMNAGAHGHSVSEILESATVFDLKAAERRVVDGSDMGFAYRQSGLPDRSIVTEGVVVLTPDEPEPIAERMREAKEWRRATQPIGLPNAGSVFKNPPGDAAGRLVEEICGKGTSVGKARVSDVHANFIVTDPGGRADEVYSLIRKIQRDVLDNGGVTLETEVKLIGEFEEIE